MTGIVQYDSQIYILGFPTRNTLMKKFAIHDLCELVRSDLPFIIKEASEHNQTLSEYLDILLYDPDNDYDRNSRGYTLKRLLTMLGVYPDKTTMDVLYKSHQNEYLVPLFHAYLNDVYLSCFDTKDNVLTVSDLCEIVNISDYDYRPHIADSRIYYSLEEGYEVPCSTFLKASEIPLLKMAHGVQFTNDFLFRTKIKLKDIIDTVSGIGQKHHYKLLEECITVLLDGPTESMKVNVHSHKDYGDYIHLDDYIKINNYVQDCNDFDVVLGSDGFIFTYHNTISVVNKILNKAKISNVLPVEQNKHITNINHPKLSPSTLVFFKKSRAMQMISDKRLTQIDDNVKHPHNFHQIFGKRYLFVRDEEQTVLTVSIHPEESR